MVLCSGAERCARWDWEDNGWGFAGDADNAGFVVEAAAHGFAAHEDCKGFIVDMFVGRLLQFFRCRLGCCLRVIFASTRLCHKAVIQ